VNLYPLPNGLSNGDGTAQYISNFSSPATEDYAMERMDFRLSDKDNFYWRYVFDPAESAGPEAVPIFATTIATTSHLVVLSETHVFSGASLNEFRFAFNRTSPIQDSIPSKSIDPSLSFVPGAPFGTIIYSNSLLQTLQLSTLGPNNAGRAFSPLNLFQETDTFSKVHGRHSLKFGADLERQQLNTLGGSNQRGTYRFGGYRVCWLASRTSSRF